MGTLAGVGAGGVIDEPDVASQVGRQRLGGVAVGVEALGPRGQSPIIRP